MKLIYSAKAREQIRTLPPPIKQDIREALVKISGDPYSGKPLQRELTGFWTFAVKRYRIIYDINAKTRTIQIYHVAHRSLIYEIFGKDLKKH